MLYIMQKSILQVINAINSGKIVAFPTETVYALACDARNSRALERIYKLKKRNKKQPLAVFFADAKQAEQYVVLNRYAKALLKAFCPGELTIIAQSRRDTNLSPFINVAGSTLGFRIPDHVFTLKLLKKLGFPVAATSVNESGMPPANSAAMVRDYFEKEIDVVIELEGQLSGKPSTIVDVSGEGFKLVREGKIPGEQIYKVTKNV